jgi:hypothetical protein
VLLPVAVETVWAAAVLPRVRRNLRIPEDAPSPLLRETAGDVLLGFAWIAYHWPLVLTALLWWAPRARVPFWVIVASQVLTAGIYAGLLLLFAAR